MSTRNWLPLVPVAIFAAALAPACGSEPEFPEQPSAMPPPAPAPTPTPAPTASAPPPVTAAACDAVQTTAFTTMMMGRAAAEAPKMEALGSLVCGTSPQGQPVNGPTFMLEQGYCYTVLANSLPNVQELDVQMVVDLSGGGIPPALAAMAATPIAVDNTTGNTAAIGAGKDCFQWVMPIPASVKLVVTPRQGDGPVAAQVYRRKK